MGVVSMASRVGGIITPFTLQLQLTIPWLTSVCDKKKLTNIKTIDKNLPLVLSYDLKNCR